MRVESVHLHMLTVGLFIDYSQVLLLLHTKINIVVAVELLYTLCLRFGGCGWLCYPPLRTRGCKQRPSVLGDILAGEVV